MYKDCATFQKKTFYWDHLLFYSMLFWVNEVVKQQVKHQKKNKNSNYFFFLKKVNIETEKSWKNVKFVRKTSLSVSITFWREKSDDILAQFWSTMIGLQNLTLMIRRLWFNDFHNNLQVMIINIHLRLDWSLQCVWPFKCNISKIFETNEHEQEKTFENIHVYISLKRSSIHDWNQRRAQKFDGWGHGKQKKMRT